MSDCSPGIGRKTDLELLPGLQGEDSSVDTPDSTMPWL
jgi:hypothetical protein